MRKYPTKKTQNLDDLDIDLQLPEELDDVAVANLYLKWALDPLAWAHYFFPHHFKKQSPVFHQQIIDDITYMPNRVHAYEAPRGSAKSTLAEFTTFHKAVFGKYRFIIFISLTEPIAAERLATIKYECQYNRLFRLFFGDLRSEKWGEKEIVLKNAKSGIHCKFLARGAGQQVLGLKYLNQRPQLIFVDDPEDMKVAENPDNVDKNERWLIKEVEPALSKEDGKLIMIGTPITADCLIERTRKRKNVHSQVFSGITVEGIPLWKEWMTREELAEKKEELSESGHLYIYYSEYLCNPIPPDRHPFREEMFYHNYYILNDIDLTKKTYNIFILVDLAIGKKKRNAFSALVVIAVDETDTWWVLDIFQAREDWYDFAKDLYAFRDKWNPLAVGVELAATQGGFWDVLRLTAEKHGYKQLYPATVIPDKDKDTRARRLLPRLRINKIKFLRNQGKLIEQLLLHPDFRFNDLKDCLAYGENFCYPPGASQPKQQKRESWKELKAATDEEMDEEIKGEIEKGEENDFDWEI